MIGKFFHLPGASKFYITPRYHNPEEDAREDREKRIKDELGIVEERVDDGKPYRPNIKGRFRMAQDGKNKSTEDARRASNTRLIILILILVLVFYLFFYSDFSF